MKLLKTVSDSANAPKTGTDEAQVTGFDPIAEYAAKTRVSSGTQCRLCRLPADLLAKVHYTYTVSKTEAMGIARYLQAHGHPEVKRHSIQHHFANEHHLSR